MDYFTSDTHFHHANIIRYCNRPFSTVEEMNNVLIENINKKVKPDDTLYHLGDFAKFDVKGIREKINCKNIVLILGNHDNIKNIRRNASLFAGIHNLLQIKSCIGNGVITEIVLCHYAMRIWNKSHYGTWHLYGHSHGTLYDDPNSLSFDVGVDPCNYVPLSITEVKNKMNAKTYKPIDHHNNGNISEIS